MTHQTRSETDPYRTGSSSAPTSSVPAPSPADAVDQPPAFAGLTRDTRGSKTAGGGSDTSSRPNPRRSGRRLAYWALEITSDLFTLAMFGLLGLTLWKLIYVAHGSAACTAPTPDMRSVIALGVAAVIAGAVGIGLGFAAISIKRGRRGAAR